MKALGTKRAGRSWAVVAAVTAALLVGSGTAHATTADTTAPTAPSGLSAARSGSDVFVSWTASTDNVGVTGYEVSIDGGAAVPTSTTAYTHVGAYQANHTYAVVALDAAGNRSLASTVSYDAATGLATSDLTGGSGSAFFKSVTSYFKDHVVVAVLSLFALTIGVGVLMGWGRKAAKSS